MKPQKPSSPNTMASCRPTRNCLYNYQALENIRQPQWHHLRSRFPKSLLTPIFVGYTPGFSLVRARRHPVRHQPNVNWRQDSCPIPPHPKAKPRPIPGMLRPWNLVRCYVQLEHQNATSVRYSNNALGSPPANLSQLPKPNHNPGTAPTAKSVVQLWVCYVPRGQLISPHYKPLLKPPAGWANTFPNSLNGIGP